MCIADDVTGLSVMHGGRRIVGVVASGQVEAVEHHLDLRELLWLSSTAGHSNRLFFVHPLLFAKVAYS